MIPSQALQGGVDTRKLSPPLVYRCKQLAPVGLGLLIFKDQESVTNSEVPPKGNDSRRKVIPAPAAGLAGEGG